MGPQNLLLRSLQSLFSSVGGFHGLIYDAMGARPQDLPTVAMGPKASCRAKPRLWGSPRGNLRQAMPVVTSSLLVPSSKARSP